MDDDLRLLLDREQIRDVLHAYCRGIDRYDVPAVAALFADDAVFTAGAGERGTVTGRAAVERRLHKLIGTFEATSHHISNIQVELAGDVATSSCYLLAWHRFVNGQPDGYLVGRYVDRLVRTSGGWRFAERTLKVRHEVDFPFPWVADDEIDRGQPRDRGPGLTPP